MKRAIFAITMTLILSAVGKTQAASPTAYEIGLKKILTHSSTTSQVYLTMALAGASEEAIRAVETDLKKSKTDDKLSAVDLVKNEITVNGKRTGVRIISYSPPQMTYKGRIWKLAPGQSMDKNYFSFMQIVEGGKKSAAHWFINEAYAFEPDPEEGGQSGMLTKSTGALLVGGFACLMSSVCPMVVGGVLIATGAAATVIPGVRPGLEVKCGKVESSISTVVDGKTSGSFKVVKKPDGTFAAQQFDDVAQRWVEYVPSDKAAFEELAKCDSEVQAAQIKKSVEAKMSSAVTIAKGGGSGPAHGAQIPADSAN